MITFRCPYAACARRLSAPDDKAGRKATCPRCKGAVWVPVLAPGYSQPPVRSPHPDWPARSATPQGSVLGDYEEEEPAESWLDLLAGGRGRLLSGPALLGILLGLAGVTLVGYYWLLYDPTVPTYSGTTGELARRFRTYNLGLQQDRLVGVLVGLGILVVGGALTALGRKR